MFFNPMFRLALLTASAVIAISTAAFAQPAADPDKPVTPPDSYRVVMENERMRMIEVHIRAHSKIDVDSPANRERFLYMLSDGALILAPPGKTPYEFALQAGETAVFPAVSPTVANDTDSAVRALMVEIKQPMRTEVASRTRGKGRHAGKGRSRTTVVVRSSKGKARHVVVSRTPKSAARASSARTAPPKAAAKGSQPLNLSKTNAKAKKVSGKSRGSSS